MKHIPNIFTLVNLLLGCMAIVFTMQTEAINIYQGEDLATSFNMPEQLAYASICIALAAVVDFFDGFIARAFRAVSEVGKQLDSLSDIVSFGVAPALILYQFLRLSLMQQENALDTSTGWLVPAFIFAGAGAFRLARFNVENSGVSGFKGVPIPAAGLLVASLPMIAHYNYFDGAVNSVLFNKWFLYGLLFLLSYLMISELPLMALKFPDRSLKNNLLKLALILIAIVASILLQWLAAPVIFISYIALSLLFKNKMT